MISSNFPTGRDGFPLSPKSRPDDQGIAVYFQLDARTRWLTYNSAALAELTQAAPKMAARLRELATPTESAAPADEGAPEADGMGLSGAPSQALA